MLVLSRKPEEKIRIGDTITVTVLEIRGDVVRLGIEAPREVAVHRQEVYEAIKKERQMRIEPNDVCTTRAFWNSVWNDSVAEDTARNVVIICKKMGGWLPFTFEDYKRLCSHQVSSAEQVVLEQFVHGGYLRTEGDRYVITKRFVAALAPYMDDQESIQREQGE